MAMDTSHKLPARLRLYSAIWRFRHIIAGIGVFLTVWALVSSVDALMRRTVISVAAAPIAAGDVIKAGDITSIRVSAANLPASMMRSRSSLEGKTARVDISAGDALTRNMVSSHKAPQSARMAIVSVPLDAASLAGIGPGASVSLYGADSDGREHVPEHNKDEGDAAPSDSPTHATESDSASVLATIVSVHRPSALLGTQEAPIARVQVPQEKVAQLIAAGRQGPLYAAVVRKPSQKPRNGQ